jgi:hypothetical protein
MAANKLNTGNPIESSCKPEEFVTGTWLQDSYLASDSPLLSCLAPKLSSDFVPCFSVKLDRWNRNIYDISLEDGAWSRCNVFFSRA